MVVLCKYRIIYRLYVMLKFFVFKQSKFQGMFNFERSNNYSDYGMNCNFYIINYYIDYILWLINEKKCY